MQFHVIFYFPLLAIPILLLLYFSGPLSSAGLTVFSTLIGTLGFIFSAGEIFSASGIENKVVPFIFLLQIAWLWSLFWIAEKLIEMKDLEAHRLLEETEKLELLGLDYQHQQKDSEKFVQGIKERISRYSQLRAFTDELAATLKLKEVQAQTEISIHKLFSHESEVHVQLHLFPYPNSSEKGDFIGEWIVKHRIPLLITDTVQDLRFPNHRFRKNGSLISCPIERENLIVGTLAIESDAPKKWREEDLRFLSDISNIVSLSIANAVYYEKIETLAVKDSLTGLFVRYRFDERVEEEFSRSKVSGSPLSLVMFDIDHFKQVNDKWGHPVGDVVLRAVSKTIMDQTRETDFCARYGGEEIAVLMPLTGISNCHRIAERIRKKIEEEKIGDQKIAVTISGGITTVNPDMKTVHDFIESADRALYQAKNDGRNRLVKDAV